MKIVPAICFAVATVAAGSLLSVSSSYAQTSLSRDAQSCDSGFLASTGMGCNFDKQVRRHDAVAGHAQSHGHGNQA